MKKYLCVDGGGTFVKHAVITEDGTILSQSKYDTPCDDLELFLTRIKDLYDAEEDIAGIALSMPGVIDIDRGFMHNAGAIHCCAGTSLCDLVSEKCGGVNVSVENDGKAAARAEMISGALKDCNSGVVVGLGTGIAGTVFIDRKIIRGSHLFGGEFSLQYRHSDKVFKAANTPERDLDGQYFCDLCTPGGIVKGYAALSGKEGLTSKDCPYVFERMEQGDEDAYQAVLSAARDLAMMIFNIQCTVDPEAFAIGGGLSAQDSFVRMVQEAVKEFVPARFTVVPTPDIRVCRYRNDANLVGALYRHLEKYGG